MMKRNEFPYRVGVEGEPVAALKTLKAAVDYAAQTSEELQLCVTVVDHMAGKILVIVNCGHIVLIDSDVFAAYDNKSKGMD